ncbi:MAG TPA: GDSL-type esterase/lipase family protein [Ktedonobacteraceae bacterium]|nr:GDSL-type esterase/lipase family protein [Ktedonobacteraceae bacterium]
MLKKFKAPAIISLCLTLIIVCASLLFTGPIAHALAAAAQSIAVTGAPGNQQASLSWTADPNATSYTIEQTDLVTGQAQQLPDVVTTTSFTATSLATGHWYRFQVIPVNGTTQGTPSAPIDIRTTGFRGSYDFYYTLGDSYSAGEGSPPYSGVTGCYRSTHSYAYLLGAGIPTPTMIACSGAVTDDIDKTVQHSNLPGTQLQQLKSSPLSNALITFTIGGNDIGFASELENCIVSFSSCTSHKASLSQKITALEPRLVQVYQEIRQAAPGADIIVLGYPLLLAAANIADCHNPIIHTGLSGSEMTMIRDLATQLDQVIAQAAGQAGVVAATTEVEQAFAGHEACTANESNEWINEITGLNALAHGSFHPNLSGYHADASALNARRNSFYQSGMVRFP